MLLFVSTLCTHKSHSMNGCSGSNLSAHIDFKKKYLISKNNIVLRIYVGTDSMIHRDTDR